MKRTRGILFLITSLLVSCDTSGNFQKGYININAIDNTHKFEVKLEVMNLYSTNNERYFKFLEGTGQVELDNVLRRDNLIFDLSKNIENLYYLKNIYKDKTYYYFIILFEDTNTLSTASSVLTFNSGSSYNIPIPYHLFDIEETGILIDVNESFSVSTKYGYSFFKDFYEKSPNLGYSYDVSKEIISLYDFFTIKIGDGQFKYDVNKKYLIH